MSLQGLPTLWLLPIRITVISTTLVHSSTLFRHLNVTQITPFYPFMMDPSTTVENAEPQVVFRPSKRRKQFRQRAEETDHTADDVTSQTVAPQPTTEASDGRDNLREDDANSETEGLSVSEVLRLRNARKSKLKGVEFRPEKQDSAVAEPGPVPKDDVNEALELGMSRRFAPQAGLVGELVNKHM